MSEWISVDERLPAESKDVKSYSLTEVIGFDGIYVFPCDFKRGNTLSDWWEFEAYGKVVKVTHWQPLPDPPQ